MGQDCLSARVEGVAIAHVSVDRLLTAHPSVNRAANSGLRPLSAAGSLKRWPLSMAVEIIATQRSSLRSTAPGDLVALHERVFSVADVMRHVLEGEPFSEAKSAQFFESAFDH